MNGTPFPWERALAIGLGVLRLPPEQFWRMTPRELAAALRGLYGEPAAPLSRAELDALVARFPDRGDRARHARASTRASTPHALLSEPMDRRVRPGNDGKGSGR
jgi:uncharacterized phage protein (TIGR02216 family)